MADANDITLDDIGDIDMVNTPLNEQITTNETTTEPVQPVAPDTSTDTPGSEDGTTPPKTEEQTEQTPASASEESESTEKPTDDSNKAYQAWIDRQRTKNETTQRINENYAPPSEDQLRENGMGDQEAKVQAAIEQLSFERERTRVAELNAGMRDEAVQVQQQFDVFNPNSPNYDKDFAEQVGENYKRDARLNTDDGGIILNADVPLFDYYQQMANFYNRGLSRGTSTAQANTEQMLARTENPGGSSSTTRSANETAAQMLERLGDMPLF